MVILKTLVQNKLEQGRTIKWAGAQTKFIPAGGSIELEGVFPSPHMKRNHRSQLLYELENDWIGLTILTNLDVKKVKAPAAASVKAPTKVRVKKADAIEKVDPTKQTPEKEGRFMVGSIDDVGKPPSVALPGSPDMPELPEKVEIFKDSGQPIGEVAVGKVDIKEAAPAPKGTTAPDTEEAKSINEKKEEVKKPRRRRTTAKKKEGEGSNKE